MAKFNSIHVPSEIFYIRPNKANEPKGVVSVHSDLDIEYTENTPKKITDDNRQFYHDILDEFLDLTPQQQLEGGFYIGGGVEDYFFEEDE